MRQCVAVGRFQPFSHVLAIINDDSRAGSLSQSCTEMDRKMRQYVAVGIFQPCALTSLRPSMVITRQKASYSQSPLMIAIIGGDSKAEKASHSPERRGTGNMGACGEQCIVRFSLTALPRDILSAGSREQTRNQRRSKACCESFSLSCLSSRAQIF